MTARTIQENLPAARKGLISQLLFYILGQIHLVVHADRYAAVFHVSDRLAAITDHAHPGSPIAYDGHRDAALLDEGHVLAVRKLICHRHLLAQRW